MQLQITTMPVPGSKDEPVTTIQEIIQSYASNAELISFVEGESDGRIAIAGENLQSPTFPLRHTQIVCVGGQCVYTGLDPAG